MKHLLLSLILIALAETSVAQRKIETTYKTVYTCEQPDGDVWYAVGLVRTGNKSSGLNLVVVKNIDESARVLIADRPVALTEVNNTSFTYEDSGSTLRLTILKVRDQFAGRFSMLMDGPGSVRNLRMDCFPDSEITFERAGGTQPRISVGN